MEITLHSIALVFFLASAAVGVILARGHSSGAMIRSALFVVHPLLGASGRILLGAAAAFGISIAYLRVKRRRILHALIITHALITLTGVRLVVHALVAGVATALAPFPNRASSRSRSGASRAASGARQRHLPPQRTR